MWCKMLRSPCKILAYKDWIVKRLDSDSHEVWQQRKQTEDNITLTQTFGQGEQKNQIYNFSNEYDKPSLKS